MFISFSQKKINLAPFVIAIVFTFIVSEPSFAAPFRTDCGSGYMLSSSLATNPICHVKKKDDGTFGVNEEQVSNSDLRDKWSIMTLAALSGEILYLASEYEIEDPAALLASRVYSRFGIAGSQVFGMSEINEKAIKVLRDRGKITGFSIPIKVRGKLLSHVVFSLVSGDAKVPLGSGNRHIFMTIRNPKTLSKTAGVSKTSTDKKEKGLDKNKTHSFVTASDQGKRESSRNRDALASYLNAISGTPLLSQDEEKRLAFLARSGDEEARQKLIKANLKLVIPLAKKYAKYGGDIMVLIQEGNIGLIKATDRYDPERSKFSTYATWWIRRQILESMRDAQEHIRIPRHSRDHIRAIRKAEATFLTENGRVPELAEIHSLTGIPEKEIVRALSRDFKYSSIEDEGSPVENAGVFQWNEPEYKGVSRRQLADWELQALMERAIKGPLKNFPQETQSRALEILRMRYRLSGYHSAMTEEEIGEVFNISKTRVTQIEEKVLRILARLAEIDISEPGSIVEKNTQNIPHKADTGMWNTLELLYREINNVVYELALRFRELRPGSGLKKKSLNTPFRAQGSEGNFSRISGAEQKAGMIGMELAEKPSFPGEGPGTPHRNQPMNNPNNKAIETLKAFALKGMPLPKAAEQPNASNIRNVNDAIWGKDVVETLEHALARPMAKRHFVFGDIHGELDGFKQALRHAGLIDNKGRWTGADQTLIQMGDMVDRGPKSIEAVNFIRELQRDAWEKSGRLVRILGNHELMFIRGMLGSRPQLMSWYKNGGDKICEDLGICLDEFNYDQIFNSEMLSGMFWDMVGDIKEGKLLAAYSAGGRLITHAGALSSMSDKEDPSGIATDLNIRLIQAVNSYDFSDRMFYSDRFDKKLSGIFWADYDAVILPALKHLNVKQIISHTPPKKHGAIVRHTGGPDFSVINVDVGYAKDFKSNRGYLVLEGTDARIVAFDKDEYDPDNDSTTVVSAGEFSMKRASEDKNGRIPGEGPGTPHIGQGKDTSFTRKRVLGDVLDLKYKNTPLAKLAMPPGIENITNYKTRLTSAIGKISFGGKIYIVGRAHKGKNIYLIPYDGTNWDSGFIAVDSYGLRIGSLERSQNQWQVNLKPVVAGKNAVVWIGKKDYPLSYRYQEKPLFVFSDQKNGKRPFAPGSVLIFDDLGDSVPVYADAKEKRPSRKSLRGYLLKQAIDASGMDFEEFAEYYRCLRENNPINVKRNLLLARLRYEGAGSERIVNDPVILGLNGNKKMSNQLINLIETRMANVVRDIPSPLEESAHGKRFRDLVRYRLSKYERQHPGPRHPEEMVIAIGTNWMRSYREENTLQYTALTPLLSDLRKFCLKHGILLIIDKDENLSRRIARKKIVPTGKNILILAEVKRDPQNKNNYTFTRLLERYRKNKPCTMIGIDGSKQKDDGYLAIVEIMLTALRIVENDEGTGKGFLPKKTTNLDVIFPGKRNDFYIFVPRAFPVEHKIYRMIYNMQRYA